MLIQICHFGKSRTQVSRKPQIFFDNTVVCFYLIGLFNKLIKFERFKIHIITHPLNTLLLEDGLSSTELWL